MKRLLLIAGFGLALLGPAVAQQSVTVYCAVGALGQAVPCGTSGNPLIVLLNSLPVGATAITGNATGTTGAVVGTLAGTAGKTTYICGFSVSAIGGTAAVGPITIANTITASLVYELASTANGTTLAQNFTPCIPASAVNTAITITTTADGTASAVAVNSWGYQQ